MSTTVIGAVTPLASALLGLALTYWINVRTRRSNFVEDLFNAAIAAVAVADASQYYMGRVGRPDGMSAQDHRDLIVNMIRDGLENHARRTNEAREALARVLPYEPRVRTYFADAAFIGERPQEIIALLREAKAAR